MSRVLCVYENIIATVSGLQDFLTSDQVKEYEIICKFVSVKNLENKDIDCCDVIWLIRPNQYFFSYIAKIAQRSGHFVILFCDDDLLNLPKESPRIPWRRKGLIKVIQNSDVVLSSNPYICKRFLKYANHKRFAVMDTAVPAESIIQWKENIESIEKIGCVDRKVKIVYAAGVAHTVLFNKYILPIMPRLAEKYGENISITFMGVKPDLKELERKIEIHYIDALPFHTYRKLIAEGNYQIGLAPLNIDAFSKAKYFNKFIEYSMMGIVGVYTKTEPYSFVVKHGHNGFLTENSSKSWFETLCYVIDNVEEREKCKNNEYQLLHQRFSSNAVIERMIQGIPELQKYSGEYKRCRYIMCYRLLYYISRFMDWGYKFFFYFKQEGISGILRRAKIHETIRKGERNNGNSII